MTGRQISYWVTTALLAFVLLSGGAAELAAVPATVQGMLDLGYPLDFIEIIGFWKILAALAILAPGLGRLKEWAYAGVFFNMTGAAASHLIIGSPSWHVAVTLTIAGLGLASWALRPASRRLGEFALAWPRFTRGASRGSAQVPST